MEEAGGIVKEIMERLERRKKIEGSKYNNIYKEIVAEELPEYLRERKKGKDRRTMARYKCGNEMRGGNIGKRKRKEYAECAKRKRKI